MKSEYHADVYDMDHVLIHKEVYIGRYKSKTWANHKICLMYPDYHIFEQYVKAEETTDKKPRKLTTTIAQINKTNFANKSKSENTD